MLGTRNKVTHIMWNLLVTFCVPESLPVSSVLAPFIPDVHRLSGLLCRELISVHGQRSLRCWVSIGIRELEIVLRHEVCDHQGHFKLRKFHAHYGMCQRGHPYGRRDGGKKGREITSVENLQQGCLPVPQPKYEWGTFLSSALSAKYLPGSNFKGSV